MTSDQLIEELLAANLYVFGIPMYNYSVPASFKAYIDQVVRVRRTFVVGADGYEGLLKHKKALVITTRGSSYAGNRSIFKNPTCGQCSTSLVLQMSPLSMPKIWQWGLMNVNFLLLPRTKRFIK
jgi:putative NADPH-quinone reductase